MARNSKLAEELVVRVVGIALGGYCPAMNLEARLKAAALKAAELRNARERAAIRLCRQCPSMRGCPGYKHCKWRAAILADPEED